MEAVLIMVGLLCIFIFSRRVRNGFRRAYYYKDALGSIMFWAIVYGILLWGVSIILPDILCKIAFLVLIIIKAVKKIIEARDDIYLTLEEDDEEDCD